MDIWSPGCLIHGSDAKKGAVSLPLPSVAVTVPEAVAFCVITALMPLLGTLAM